MTYTGSDARDNQDRPPSVVIDELLDYIERCFEMPLTSSRSLRDQILVRHPLQSFSPRYLTHLRPVFLVIPSRLAREPKC